MPALILLFIAVMTISIVFQVQQTGEHIRMLPGHFPCGLSWGLSLKTLFKGQVQEGSGKKVWR